MGIKKISSFVVRLLLAISLASSLFAQLYIKKGNIFREGFVEPFEILYIIFYDGDMYSFTTQHINSLRTPMGFIKELLNKEGKEIKDIAIVVHNHFARPFFSKRDLKTLRYLKEHGFSGSFLIYIKSTRRVVAHGDSRATFKGEFMEWLFSKDVQKFFKGYKKKYPEASEVLVDYLKEQMK